MKRVPLPALIAVVARCLAPAAASAASSSVTSGGKRTLELLPRQAFDDELGRLETLHVAEHLAAPQVFLEVEASCSESCMLSPVR